MTDPAKRSVIGMFLVLGIIAIWAVIIGSFSEAIGRLPILVQLLVYLVAGIAWIFAAMPVMRWIVIGRFRK